MVIDPNDDAEKLLLDILRDETLRWNEDDPAKATLLSSDGYYTVQVQKQDKDKVSLAFKNLKNNSTIVSFDQTCAAYPSLQGGVKAHKTELF